MIGGTGIHERNELVRAIETLADFAEECASRDIRADCESALAYYRRWGTISGLDKRFCEALLITDQYQRYYAVRNVVQRMRMALPNVFYKEGGG